MFAALFSVAGCAGQTPVASTGGDAVAGGRTYDKSCAVCHGPGATGTDQGPPLVDRIYEPSHHGDASFLLAVRRGTPAHHWGFGDMPPVPAISDSDVTNVVAYVRRLQVAAGIR